MHDSGGVLRSKARKLRRRLSWALVLGTLLVLGINCGGQAPRLSRGSDFIGGMRRAAGDTSRLLRNAHYFKLMGQPELGIKEMEEAYRLDPGNLKLADALAQYYDELGMGARAQQIYLEALALAPDNPALQNNLCFSYYQAGDWSQAETCYRQTLTRQPKNQVARNNLGLVLCRLGRQEEARRLWQEAEGEAVAPQRLAAALEALGMAGETRYARQTPTHPGGQSISHHSPPGAQRGGDPVTAPAAPLSAQASSPSVTHEIETAARPAVPPPAEAAAKLAAVLPAEQSAPDSRSRELPGFKTVEDRDTPADPPSHQPAPGLEAGNRPAQPLPPRSEMAAAPPPLSPRQEAATPARPVAATSQPVFSGQPDPKGAAGDTSLEKPRGNPRAPITVKELLETHITILNGNGSHNLARHTRSRLHLEGYNAIAINNFSNFAVNRTVIYYRPDAERVATILNKKFFPGAELEPAPRLADSIDVRVVLGHDLGPQQQAEGPQAHGLRL
jgi:Tfp pilus assembly protein PilF